jgi:pimeloyl-ACP methyl ester carboxylesterase
MTRRAPSHTTDPSTARVIESQHARLAHGTIEYVDEGEGSPLVLLHGLGGNWQHWLANIPGLAQRHRVIALDLPGFGRSGELPAQVTIARLADAVVALLDELGINCATFVGNSMGGMVAIEVAARHPHRVGSAVLVASAGIPLTWRQRLVNLPLGIALNRALRCRPVRRLALRHPAARRLIVSRVFCDPRRVPHAHVAPALEGLGARGFEAAVRAGLRYDARIRAQHVRCRTLILWGGHDRLLPRWMGDELHGLIPQSELVVWDDTGHCPMIEHPARFDELVAAFAGRSSDEPLTFAG